MTELPGLMRSAQRYRLEIGNVQTWTPYWINWDEPPYWLNAPLRGKGSPEDIRREAVRVIMEGRKTPATAEAMRRLMRVHGLGVDCSGFVYHVLDGWMQDILGMRLADHLVIGSEDVRSAMVRQPRRAEALGLDVSLPRWLPLGAVCRQWDKDPAQWTNVRRLIHPRSVVPVRRACDARPGDLISMTSSYGDHIAVVLEVSERQITYGASEDEAGGLGGVRLNRQIRLLKPEFGLEDQEWSQRKIFSPQYLRSGWPADYSNGLWRLRPLVSLGRT